MQNPKYVYELLLDHCTCTCKVEQLVLGLVWTLCRNNAGNLGLAMSPGGNPRTLNWPGSLQGKPVHELAEWIYSWEPNQATVAMAAINSCLGGRALPNADFVEPCGERANLAVFDYFLPQLLDRRVVVVGRYPGIDHYKERMQLTVLERHPETSDLPDQACEYVLADAEWVFITATSIPNKTFPRLAELAAGATSVLMGPTLPWLPQLHEFGIDYLAGVETVDAEALYHTAAQGGGVRIFEKAVRYRIAKLTPECSMNWLKREIADCNAEKLKLTADMERWYAYGNRQRFPDFDALERANRRLSRLDGSFKPLWDEFGKTAAPSADKTGQTTDRFFCPV